MRIFGLLILSIPMLWLLSTFAAVQGQSASSQTGNQAPNQQTNPQDNQPATAIVAGGCFWCVETDFEKCPGVLDVVSGYSGGRSKNPTYETYSSSGHREVVMVTYNPKMITYAGICEWLIKHVDATDPGGQFKDRGKQYSPAIYYANDEQKQQAEEVIAALDKLQVFPRGQKIAVELVERAEFWPAEGYHQDYHRKNTIKYSYFRFQSGRDAFVSKHWGVRANKLELKSSYAQLQVDENAPWRSFQKPPVAELKKSLNRMQFKVTQEDGTEPAFGNAYWNNKREGIYVDIVSGAPLFSSTDKFRSGTGWPSFVRPIEADAVYLRPDRKMFVLRTEVRSRFGDSHLGHVFNDGPPAQGGKRFCMNSASMRFIEKDELEAEGYGAYLKLFADSKKK